MYSVKMSSQMDPYSMKCSIKFYIMCDQPFLFEYTDYNDSCLKFLAAEVSSNKMIAFSTGMDIKRVRYVEMARGHSINVIYVKVVQIQKI